MARTQNSTITKKLTRMNMLVSGAALLMACAAFVTYDLITFREAMVRNLSIQARVTGSNSVTALVFNDSHAAENTLSALKAAPSIVSAGIYSLDGQNFAAYRRDPNVQLPHFVSADQGETHLFKDGNVIVTNSIVFQGKPTGMVYIRSDLRRLNAQVRRYAIIAAVVLAASLLTALLLSSVFRRSIAEPIVHLAEVAHAVSRDKNYTIRATRRPGRDELSTLIESFNEMLTQIQEHNGALQRAHDGLEEGVQERTAALTEANEQLQREMTERKKTEKKFRAFLQSSPDATVIVNQEGEIVLANTQTEKLFGYSSEELLNHKVEILLPERFRGRHPGHRGRFFGDAKMRPMGAGPELFARRKDGTEFSVEISLNPLETEEGTLVSGAIRDITERKTAEEALERQRIELARSNAGLVEANKELESFSYSVSHDLRAPLRTIDGFSHALLEDCADRLDDAGKTHLNRIRAATQRMGSLIDDLLNLSRITRTEFNRQNLDISALACSVASDLQKAQPERQIELRIEDGLKTAADPGLLRVALENLLSNAWKFTSKRASAHIEFGMARDNGTPAYFVRDDGAGFDLAYANRLFGAFQRLHAMTEFAGTGVGLATVQRIIHRHGGRIWAESAVGQGATFYFTLSETAS